jgi:hypothetical protein
MVRSAKTATLIWVLTVAIASATAQMPPASHSGMPTAEQDETDRELQHRLQMARQKHRVEEMQRDSQKLVELANELKQYVDKAGEHVLSMEVIRKADELEKLARRVKENMRSE